MTAFFLINTNINLWLAVKILDAINLRSIENNLTGISHQKFIVVSWVITQIPFNEPSVCLTFGLKSETPSTSRKPTYTLKPSENLMFVHASPIGENFQEDQVNVLKKQM